MTRAFEVLSSLGHRVIGRVTGPAHLVHTKDRSAAMAAAVERLALDARVVEADYTPADGVRAVGQLLEGPDAPTAIIFDNDVMAVAALEHLAGNGVGIPEDISLLAWDDSVLCEMTTPPLSAISIDVHEHGVHVGKAVLGLLNGAEGRDIAGPLPRVVLRQSTRARSIEPPRVR